MDRGLHPTADCLTELKRRTGFYDPGKNNNELACREEKRWNFLELKGLKIVWRFSQETVMVLQDVATKHLLQQQLASSKPRPFS